MNGYRSNDQIPIMFAVIQQATTKVLAMRKVGVPKNRANASARLANQPSVKAEDAEANGRFNRKNSSRYFRSNSASMVSSVSHEGPEKIARPWLFSLTPNPDSGGTSRLARCCSTPSTRFRGEVSKRSCNVEIWCSCSARTESAVPGHG